MFWTIALSRKNEVGVYDWNCSYYTSYFIARFERIDNLLLFRDGEIYDIFDFLEIWRLLEVAESCAGKVAMEALPLRDSRTGKFCWSLLTIYWARSPNYKVLTVYRQLYLTNFFFSIRSSVAPGAIVQIIMLRDDPPSDAFRIYVNFESL